MEYRVMFMSSNWSLVSVCLSVSLSVLRELFTLLISLTIFRLTSYILSLVFIHFLFIHVGPKKVGALRPEYTSRIGLTPKSGTY